MKNLLTIVLPLVCTTLVSAKTIRVGKNETVASIQTALDIAQPGDSIVVGTGTYTEGSLIIKKTVSLIGLNYPVLDGQRKNQVLTIDRKSVV